jgi:stage II sporulation protein D
MRRPGLVLALLLMPMLLAPSTARAQTPPQTSRKSSGAPAADTTELRVRLFAIHSPAEMRISPRDASARVRLCSRCKEKRLTEALEIRLAAARLSLTPAGSAEVVMVSGSVRLETPGNAAVDVQLPLEIRAENGRLRVELRMPIEEYVAGVVAGEGVGFTSPESLKAMAVAARTFAMHFRGRHRAEGFDLCDTTHCQDLHLGAITARMRAAAEATRDEILWFEGRPAATYHHRHCGGSTEDARMVWADAAAPYLIAHKDAYCLARDPGRWSTEIAKRDLAHALAASHLEAPARLETLSILERSSSGRAVLLRLAGPEAVDLRAADLRFAVGRALGWEKIPSDLYELRDTGETIVFEGRGAGHGVGMCQTGAAEMGVQGKAYREILAFYFPGTMLSATAP